jgi:hypothetical protein
MFVAVKGYRVSRWSKFRSKRPSDEKSRFEVIVAEGFLTGIVNSIVRKRVGDTAL